MPYTGSYTFSGVAAPLAPSRIVPMFNHYAGNWYPYQDEKGHNPGVIIDPKSPVVVGAAIEFMARHGMLPQFKFEMRGKAKENSYYWGVMTDATSGIRPERILFEPIAEGAREEITEFSTIAQRVLIGRKLNAGEDAQALELLRLLHAGVEVRWVKDAFTAKAARPTWGDPGGKPAPKDGKGLDRTGNPSTPLPAVVNVEDAAKDGAPKVWDDNAMGNLAFPLMMGNKDQARMRP